MTSAPPRNRPATEQLTVQPPSGLAPAFDTDVTGHPASLTHACVGSPDARQSALELGQRFTDVGGRVGRRNRALLGRDRYEERTQLDERAPQGEVAREIVVFDQVVE